MHFTNFHPLNNSSVKWEHQWLQCNTVYGLDFRNCHSQLYDINLNMALIPISTISIWWHLTWLVTFLPKLNPNYWSLRCSSFLRTQRREKAALKYISEGSYFGWLCTELKSNVGNYCALGATIGDRTQKYIRRYSQRCC